MASDSYDIRRYLAILFSAGAAITLTGMLAWTIFLLSNSPGFIFWIAVGLLILVGLMQTGFISLLVQRDILISKDKIVLKDKVIDR